MPDDADTHQVTRLLGEIAEGKDAARDELVRAVYNQLRKIAQMRMAAERPDHTLQATALVHEAYLKLAPGLAEREIKNHYDFYGAASEAMRRILVDHARARSSQKRGGGLVLRLESVAQLADADDPEAVMALDEAFEILEKRHSDLARLVRLRFFAGLSVEETARVLEVSEPTVKRRWQMARMILFDLLEKKSESS